MAGRKVFTSGEILTAADVNSFLMNQVVAVFADSTARSSAIPSPSEGMVTYVEDANRVEVYDGSAFGPIGGILQVVSTTKTDSFSASVAGSSFTSNVTGLEATITPSSASSKVLVIVDINFARSGNLALGSYKIMRDSTAVSIADTAGSRALVSAAQIGGGTQNSGIASATKAFLDSPSTISAITYGIQLYNQGSTTQTIFVNRSSTDSDAADFVRSTSSITLMEVAV